MGNQQIFLISILSLVIAAQALIPYRNLWDILTLPDDPFRILEQSPIEIPRGVDPLPLARADWRETATNHAISIDIPGIKKEEVKIEVEENRVLRISGEIKEEEEMEGEKWHRNERVSGKFVRQFRLPGNCDVEKVKANLENGVLRIVVPKLGEEKRKEVKVISVGGEGGGNGEVVKATKGEL